MNYTWICDPPKKLKNIESKEMNPKCNLNEVWNLTGEMVNITNGIFLGEKFSEYSSLRKFDINI